LPIPLLSERQELQADARVHEQYTCSSKEEWCRTSDPFGTIVSVFACPATPAISREIAPSIGIGEHGGRVEEVAKECSDKQSWRKARSRLANMIFVKLWEA
jgi:hypothetical protein